MEKINNKKDSKAHNYNICNDCGQQVKLINGRWFHLNEMNNCIDKKTSKITFKDVCNYCEEPIHWIGFQWEHDDNNRMALSHECYPKTTEGTVFIDGKTITKEGDIEDIKVDFCLNCGNKHFNKNTHYCSPECEEVHGKDESDKMLNHRY